VKTYVFRADRPAQEAIEAFLTVDGEPPASWPSLVRRLLEDEVERQGGTLEFFDPDADYCDRDRRGRPSIVSVFTPTTKETPNV